VLQAGRIGNDRYEGNRQREDCVRREGWRKRDGGERDGTGSSATGQGQRRVEGRERAKTLYKGEVGAVWYMCLFSPLDTSRPLGLLVRISFNSQDM
jgi:hypothetical protein